MKFLINLFLIFFMFLISSCLQTRADLGNRNQSQIYKSKNQENHESAQDSKNVNNSNNESGENVVAPKVDERDETIRQLNGRIESLENQLVQMQKEKADQKMSNSNDAQKIQILQDAISKMEEKLQKLDSSETHTGDGHKKVESSDEILVKKNNHGLKPSSAEKHTEAVISKKISAFEAAEEQFKKKDYKKAILSYQQHIEENPKAKNLAEAKYKIGVSFQELGMKEEALAFYEEVIAQYPKTESGKKAKIRQTSLNKKK